MTSKLDLKNINTKAELFRALKAKLDSTKLEIPTLETIQKQFVTTLVEVDLYDGIQLLESLDCGKFAGGGMGGERWDRNESGVETLVSEFMYKYGKGEIK